jgi:hypothetical protein
MDAVIGADRWFKYIAIREYGENGIWIYQGHNERDVFEYFRLITINNKV